MTDAMWANLSRWLLKYRAVLVVPIRGAPFLASAGVPPRGRNWIPGWPGPGRFVESSVLESYNQGTPHHD